MTTKQPDWEAIERAYRQVRFPSEPSLSAKA